MSTHQHRQAPKQIKQSRGVLLRGDYSVTGLEDLAGFFISSFQNEWPQRGWNGSDVPAFHRAPSRVINPQRVLDFRGKCVFALVCVIAPEITNSIKCVEKTKNGRLFLYVFLSLAGRGSEARPA